MSQPRFIQLDLLRAVCVFLVFGRHLIICPPEINFYLSEFTRFWNNGGWIGVDIFFVLSGFLVSGLLFQEYQKNGNLQLKRFLIRRGFKIYPAFYVMIVATVLINPLYDKQILLKPLFAEIFFLQNFLFGRLWWHTWSLAVEEHFYIGLAILTFILISRKRKSANPFSNIPQIFVFLAISCFGLRLLMAIFKGTNISPTPFRIDSMFFGVFISYLWHFRGLAENVLINRYKNWLITAGVLMFLPMFFFVSYANSWTFVFGLTTNYLAGGLLLIGLLKSDIGKSWFIRILAYIGVYSYSIYLWHLPVQDWLAIPLNKTTEINNWFLYATLYLVGAILLGVVMSKIIEYPILRIRNKYFPSPNYTS